MVRKDISYGIIPLKKVKEEWQTLLIHHLKGHWGFPKGHKDDHETPLECAIRELKEETGLEIISLFPTDPLQEHYFFTWNGELIEKTVTYFSALVTGSLKLDENEIDDAKWLSFKHAEKKVSFKESKKICKTLSRTFT